MSAPTVKCLKLDSIRLDGGTQIRVELDQSWVCQISEEWLAGAVMPPVVVFHDGSAFWLADGFHRYHAAKLAGFKDLQADVRSGTRLDAIRFALGCNTTHGQRRSSADKQRAVEIALREFPNLSSRQIAEICAVSDPFVGKFRSDVLTVSTSLTRTDTLGRQQPATKLRREPRGEAEAMPTAGSPLRPVISTGRGFTEEERAAGEQAAADSGKLWTLKSAWKQTGKKDRKLFLEWIGERVAEHAVQPGGKS